MAAVEKLREFISEDPRIEVFLDRYRKQISLGSKEYCFSQDQDIAFLELLAKHFDDPSALDMEKVKAFPLPVLFSYLKNTHAYYLDKRLFEIDMSIDRIKEVCGHTNSIWFPVKLFWMKFITDLQQHIHEEESHLFPIAESLMNKDTKAEETPACLSVNHISELKEILEEHEDDDLERGIGKFVSFVKGGYPDLEELMYVKVLILQLEVFQHDLEIHRRIEEEAFIPMLAELAGL
ncbi:MAG: hypothetical protein AAF388_04640 [Bacteroidota bacterium]